MENGNCPYPEEVPFSWQNSEAQRAVIDRQMEWVSSLGILLGYQSNHKEKIVIVIQESFVLLGVKFVFLNKKIALKIV